MSFFSLMEISKYSNTLTFPGREMIHDIYSQTSMAGTTMNHENMSDTVVQANEY